MKFLPLPQSTLLKCYLLALKQQEVKYLNQIQMETLSKQTLNFIQPKLKYIAQNTIITGKTTLNKNQLYEMYQVLAIDFIKKQINNLKQYPSNENTLQNYRLELTKQILKYEKTEGIRKEQKNHEIEYL